MIHLGSGEPDCRIPEAAAQAAQEMLAEGRVRYTAASGTPEMKQAVIQYTKKHYGVTPEAPQVVISSGAKQALANALYALSLPGDEILFLAPYWVSYPDMVRLAGGVPRVLVPEDNSFTPPARFVVDSLNDRTKAIILNSPNNPSGAVYSREFICEVSQACAERGIWLIMDDIYHRLVFEDDAWTSIYDCLPGGIEESRVVVINGVSKLYGMTGFRIGWAVGPSELIGAMGRMQAQITSCPSALSQTAAVAALQGEQDCVEQLRADLRSNADILLDCLRDLPGVKVQAPQGTFYCFADFRAYCDSSKKLAEILLGRALVITVPGDAFGMEGHLRLSTCGSAEQIREGIARIRWALDPAAPATIKIGDQEVTRDW